MGKGLSFSEIESMRSGARTAVRVCMNVQAVDRALIICDRETAVIARLIAEEVGNVGTVAECVYLEDYGRRPLTAFPPALKQHLIAYHPTVTFFVAQGEPGEVQFRIALYTFLQQEIRARHAHMIGITPRLMKEGMAVDYLKVAEATAMVYEQARCCQEIHIHSAKGTDLRATFNQDWRWVKADGLYHKQGQWGNLPEGEVFTAPRSVNGVIAAEVLGDYFSKKYGVLSQPVFFHIENSGVIRIDGAGRKLRHELEAYLQSGENSDRVGELAIGTNIGLKQLSGNMLQDEKFPGIHIAFGDPYPELTGADWRASTHMDVVTTNCTVEMDDQVIMRDGRFDYDILRIGLRYD